MWLEGTAFSVEKIEVIFVESLCEFFAYFTLIYVLAFTKFSQFTTASLVFEQLSVSLPTLVVPLLAVIET